MTRLIEKSSWARKDSRSFAFIFDLNRARKADLLDNGQCARFLTKTCITELAQQTNPRTLLGVMKRSQVDFMEPLRNIARSRPLWSHIEQSSKTVEDLWLRLAPTQAGAAEVLQLVRLSEDPLQEFKMWMNVLENCGKRIIFSIQHMERLPGNNFGDGPLKVFMDPPKAFSVFLECNDSLKTVWNMPQDTRTVTIVRVPDLPTEAVKAIFVPSLLSDDTHVNTLLELCGGRIGLLERVIDPLNILNEEQRLQNEEHEQRYRSGTENRPSAESKDLQVDPLIYKREVTLRDSIVNGVFKDEVEKLKTEIDEVIAGFEPLSNLRGSMSEMEFKVLICESVRTITEVLENNSFMAIPAGKSPLDIAHPVVLGLLNANILMSNWAQVARIEAESPLKLFMLKSWYSACIDELSLHERINYNRIHSKNHVHLKRQLEKLVV
jgi:hypothetical protein